MENILFILLLSSTLVSYTSGWKSLMNKIPNADYVKNPCNKNESWQGVGHLQPGGYGRRNQFGVDFNTYGKTWTREFCMLDSDNDGRTNGEELGDPTCIWTPGTVLNIDPVSITHPGICEPLDSQNCRTKNHWLKCQETKFDCPAINNPDTKNVTITFPKLSVPQQETTHKCMVFEFPQDGDFHMVATQPLIDNKKVMHHITVFGCENDKEPKYGVGEVHECGFAFDPACHDLLSVWVLGVDGECMHGNTGFRIGNHGYRRGGIQLHWENQQLLPDEVDGSGITIFYTDQRRLFDAGVLFIGQQYMNIPPRTKSHVEVGHCYPECTERKWSKDLHITFALNHMHYLGRNMKIEHLRNGEVIHIITDEHNYDFDSPLMHIFKDPIVVSPGDEIRTTCVFDSTTRDVTTRAGAGYMEEMCYGFLTFYPKQAVSNGATSCTSWKQVPYCRFELDDEVNGCDFKNVRNLSHSETRTIFNKVMKHCRPFGPCYSDCREVVKEISALPCYHGDMWAWQRDKMGGAYDNTTETAEWYQFYAAMDSCLSEISNSADNNYNDNIGSHGSLIQTDIYLYINLVIQAIVLYSCVFNH